MAVLPPLASSTDAGAGWRFALGTLTFITAFALWLLVPLAALAGVGPGRIAAVTGTVMVANKVLLVVAIALVGKAGFLRLRGLAFGYARGLVPTGPIGPIRHWIGIAMFSIPLLSAVLEPYLDQFFPGLRPNVWQFQVLGDAMLIASFFVLGGDFWSKLRALFVRTARVAGEKAS